MRRQTYFHPFLSLALAAVVLASGARARADTPSDILARLLNYSAQPAVQFQLDAMSASRSGSSLIISVPVVNGRKGSVKVEWDFSIRNVKGAHLGSASGRETIKPGTSVLNARMAGVSPGNVQEEEIDYVLRYSLRAGGKARKGRKSLFHLLPKPTLDLHAPKEILSGAVARIPIIMRDAMSQKPYANAKVKALVTLDGKQKASVRATTDQGGVAVVELPAMGRGTLSIRASGQAQGSSDAVAVGESKIVDRKRVFLSTDKPLYQPGQTIHIRAIMFQSPANRPVAKQKTTVEVFDPKGNKVFKEELATNRFGIVHTAFTLASQITLGSYRVELVASDTTAKKSVKVERYVLPKFKVSVEPERTWYGPGETITGKVNAGYFFGKPVAGGHIEMTFYDYKGTWKPMKVLDSKLSADGVFGFEFRLPDKLVGSPMAGGDATVLVKTVVTDTGGQKNEVATNLLVSASPIKIFLFPETGQVVPGVENRFYVVLSDPAGTPVPGECEVTFGASSNSSVTVKGSADASGLAVVAFTPTADQNWNAAHVLARDNEKRSASAQFSLSATTGEARILVRPSRSIARAGDTITLEVLASGAVSDAYVDITRANQTIWVSTLKLENGRGLARIDLDETMKGALAISAYVLSQRGEFTRDSRALFVDSASDLKVEAAMDKSVYKPAETATITFAVNTPDGNPAPAALGVHIVDEAVFALSEARPGLLKLYFALEEELLQPTYQIGRMFGQTLGNLILHASTADADERRKLDATADATIAAQGDVAVAKQFTTSSIDLQDKVAGRIQAFAQWLQKRLRARLERMRKCGSRGWYEFDREQLAYAKRKFRTDPWGTPYDVQAETEQGWIYVHSLGPDGREGTWDDFNFEMYAESLCPDQRPRMVKFAVRGGMADKVFEGAAFGAGGGGGAMVPGTASIGVSGASTPKQGKAVRVRQWFPETLLVENCIVTDENGKASLDVLLADSITSWRMTSVASDLQGNIGGTTDAIKVFQDFFVDIDFPVFMTQNDQVTFPIVVYNYLDTPQEVEIEVMSADWFDLRGPSKTKLAMKVGEVTSVNVPVKVTRVGLHALTVYGRGSGGFADAVKRSVTVRPDGEEQTAVAGGKLRASPKTGDGPQTIPVGFPKNTIEGSRQLVVQVLGGLSSHVVQGMDSMLKLPGG